MCELEQVHLTIVGVGVDLSVGTVERISAIRSTDLFLTTRIYFQQHGFIFNKLSAHADSERRESIRTRRGLIGNVSRETRS